MQKTCFECYRRYLVYWSGIFRGTIDFMLSKKRDEATAKAFFIKAIESNGLPEKVTIDKIGANKAGIDAINLQLTICYLLGCSLMQIHVRQIKYLNNIVEPDHREIKRITKSIMGFKAFHSAEATLAGIELYRMLKKANILMQKTLILSSNFMR